MQRTYRILALTVDDQNRVLKVIDRQGRSHEVPVSDTSCKMLNQFLGSKLTDEEISNLGQESERQRKGDHGD